MPTIVSTRPTTTSAMPPALSLLASPIQLLEPSTSAWRNSTTRLRRVPRCAPPRRQLFASCNRPCCSEDSCPITPSPALMRQTPTLDHYLLDEACALDPIPSTPGPVRRRRRDILRPDPVRSHSRRPTTPPLHIPTIFDFSSRTVESRPTTPTRNLTPNNQIQFRNLMPVLIADTFGDDSCASIRPPRNDTALSDVSNVDTS